MVRRHHKPSQTSQVPHVRYFAHVVLSQVQFKYSTVHVPCNTWWEHGQTIDFMLISGNFLVLWWWQRLLKKKDIARKLVNEYMVHHSWHQALAYIVGRDRTEERIWNLTITNPDICESNSVMGEWAAIQWIRSWEALIFCPIRTFQTSDNKKLFYSLDKIW